MHAKQASVLIPATQASLVVLWLKETLQANLSWSFHRIKCSCIALCSNCAWHIFIRVDAANEVAGELIAEPVQEPRAEEPQKVAVEPAPEDFVNPADLQGKPRSITII